MRSFVTMCTVVTMLLLVPATSTRHAQTQAAFGIPSPPTYSCSGINPKDPIYGAVGDGTTDDTSALNLAISDAQTTFTPLCLPPGTYSVTTLTTSTTPPRPLTILGAGPDNSTISTISPTGNVLTLNKSGLIAHIGFTSSVTRTAGAFLVFTAGANDTTLNDFSITNAFTGIVVNSGATNRIQNGKIRYTVAGGDSIIEDGGNDHYVSYVTMDALATAQPHSGIWYKSGGATQISHCDIIHQGYDLIINGGSVWSDHTYYDTAVRGWYVQALLAPIIRVTSDHDWMSSHTGNGIVITNGPYVIGGITFRDPTVILNTVNGFANLASGDIGLAIQGGIFAGNGASGIYNAGDAARYMINGARVGSVPGVPGNTVYGVYHAAGVGDYFTWSNLDLIGNGAGPYYNGSTGTHNQITGLKF